MAANRRFAVRRFVPVQEWDDRRQRRGVAGEWAAYGYLTACGWDVESHRFRLGRHDVDLIARRGPLVAFVEVKTRRSSVCGGPAEAVGALKRHSIAKVAELWRIRFGRPDDEYRFDLVSVYDHGGGRYLIEHCPDAWRLDRPVGWR